MEEGSIMYMEVYKINLNAKFLIYYIIMAQHPTSVSLLPSSSQNNVNNCIICQNPGGKLIRPGDTRRKTLKIAVDTRNDQVLAKKRILAQEPTHRVT